MEQKVNIDILNDSQKQALVCMYYAMLPKTDVRYKQRMHDWEVLEKRFGIKKSTYRYAKDTFDSYFTGNGRKGWGESRETFKSKIIMYLFEDAAKQRRHMLFGGCDEDIRNQYSTICEEFDKRGIDIFCKEIRDKIKKEYLSELE